MNVLEKILEEIEDHAIEFKSFGMCDDYVSVGWAKDIIRSHMGDVPKCRECSRRKFYMQGYEDGKKNDGWIPVSEKLPEESSIYIVSAKEGGREIVTFVKWQNRFKKWDLSGTRAYWRVTAWKPLPKPYKEV